MANKIIKVINDISTDLDAVQNALSFASQHGLVTEVVTYALKYMKENSSLTIEEAITMGLDEWVK